MGNYASKKTKISEKKADSAPLQIAFDDNSLLPTLFGEHDRHLARLEQKLDVQIVHRGNELSITGNPADQDSARKALESLYMRLDKGLDVSDADVDGAIRIATAGLPSEVTAGEDYQVRTRKKTIHPRSARQKEYLEQIGSSDLVFGLGPAGTGKTYLAVAMAVKTLLEGRVDRLILTRPAVEAGENLGFLPGDLKEKIDPYLQPLYDALYDMLPAEQVERRMEEKTIEIAPLAFMRGRTLANAFVILDEAQNTTHNQMKMFLTRLGEGAQMVITGDLSQVDLPRGVRSGLREALEVLDGVKGVKSTTFDAQDVVRHPMVARIINAYDSYEAKLRRDKEYKRKPLKDEAE